MSQILIKGFTLQTGNRIYYCEHCGNKIENGDMYFSKRRTNHTVSYCINCAVILNIVLEDEVEERVKFYKDRGCKVKKKKVTKSEIDLDEIEFTLTPIEKKEKKKTEKSRADIMKDIGIRPRYRHKRSRRR